MMTKFLSIVLVWVSSLYAQSNTRFSLVAEQSSFVPGETVMLGLRFEMQPEWHIYFSNPGDSGFPPSYTWELPEGFRVGEVQWPVPKRLIVAGLVSYAYEEEAVFLIPLQTPANLAVGTSVNLKVDAEWLECKDMCLPGNASAELTLTAVSATSPVENPLFERARQALIRLPAIEAQRTGSDIRIPLAAAAWTAPFRFFPMDEGVWLLDPEPMVSVEGEDLVVRLQANPTGVPAPERLRGLLLDADNQGFQVKTGSAAIATDAPIALGTVTAAAPNVLGLMVLTFFAGIMLNLMPCIFPVLGLKISSFIEQAQGDSGSLRKHAWVFAAGILVSLWILGAAVSALGTVWGAQFQDPRVVIGMLLVLTLFTMNLFGVFEMGNAMTRVGGDLTQKQGYSGSFFQGVLLTVIGTPCTGPVMAAVIGPLLTQPPFVVFVAFTVMGIGLAAPYVILAYLPKLIEKLPPPGMWMVTFKQGSAFMMVLFLWGLLYVLHGLEPGALVPVTGALLLVCFAAWVLGTWGAPERKDRVRGIAKIAALLLLLASGGLAYSYHKPLETVDATLRARIEAGEPLRWTDVTPKVAAQLLEEGVPLHYRPFTPELLAELRAAGKAVFIDFTADWCTQCKVNKITTLHRDNVMRAFAKAEVVTLRADLTKRDDALTALLAEHGRRGLPVYMLYGRNPAAEVRFLSETLSPEIVSEALDSLSK